MPTPRPSKPAALVAITLAATLAVPACDINFFLCEPADEETLARLPRTLAETGIDDAGVILYAARFGLWADGAAKRRWLALPEGERIDTSNPDVWDFPVGTSLWKEFSRGGVALETRLLRKLGPGLRDWGQVSYVWTEDGSQAIAEPLGRLGARGTDHNVPAAGECSGCHGGRKSWILGLSAVQLAFDDGDDETASLADLDALGLLTDPVLVPDIPGNELEKAALGYLHANCSHCHNRDRPERERARCFDPKNTLDFFLALGSLGSVSETATYSTVVGSDVIVRGNPDASDLFDRVDQRGFIYQMPPLGSEKIDREAVEVLRQWIEGL